jgi:hypothetical protein
MRVVRAVRRMLPETRAHPVVGIPQVLIHADTMTHRQRRPAEPVPPPGGYAQVLDSSCLVDCGDYAACGVDLIADRWVDDCN